MGIKLRISFVDTVNLLNINYLIVNLLNINSLIAVYVLQEAQT
jgi:hypothetical protein